MVSITPSQTATRMLSSSSPHSNASAQQSCDQQLDQEATGAGVKVSEFVTETGNQSMGQRQHFVLLSSRFRNYIILEKSLFTFYTLNFTFISNHQQSLAIRTGLRDRSLPGGEITLWIIITTEESTAFARLSFDKIAAILGAGDADLL